MPTLKEIKGRIGSVKSTLKITSAMKLVSSAKLRSANPEVIETLASGKIDDETTAKIEAVMADIAGTYKL